MAGVGSVRGGGGRVGNDEEPELSYDNIHLPVNFPKGM